jgi:hypothetical protein
MNPTHQQIHAARRVRLSGQTHLLYEIDQNGQRVYGEDGEQIFDLNRAPVVLADIGVPRTLLDATFASSRFSEVDVVRDWFSDLLASASGECCALLIGDGSNYTAAAVLRNAVKRGRTVAWYRWHDFTKRYTDAIDRSHLLARGNTEESATAGAELYDAEDETFHLHYVYEVLAIVDFDIDDVRDFAVPQICDMIRARTSAGLITVVTVPTANSEALRRNAVNFGSRGAILRLFENESVVFDGR